jgi:hypothetical protein
MRMRLEDYINNVQERACVDLQWVSFTVLSLLLLLLLSSTFLPKADGRSSDKINALLPLQQAGFAIYEYSDLARLKAWSLTY